LDGTYLGLRKKGRPQEFLGSLLIIKQGGYKPVVPRNYLGKTLKTWVNSLVVAFVPQSLFKEFFTLD